jgi:hypothetical protein
VTLQDKLDSLREAAKARIPPEAHAVMERSIEALRASGIMQRVARVGQAAPDFTPPGATGGSVRLANLRAGVGLALAERWIGFHRFV